MKTQATVDALTLTWEEYFAHVRNRDWLTAKALLELDASRTLQQDAQRWIASPQRDGHLAGSGEWVWELELDWDAWVADVDARGRGWSRGEYRLFELAAGLLTGRPFNLFGVLDGLGSWKVDVWRILTDWGPGGDDRVRPGR